MINTSSDSVVATIPVGSYPWALAYDNASGEVFVVNYVSANVSVINDTTDRVVATIPVGGPASYPDAIVYDSALNEVLVADYWSNNVSAINTTTNTIVTTFPVGMEPTDMAYDPANGEAYASNVMQGTVSIIAAGNLSSPSSSTPVTFAETGLPSGTIWSVTLNGTAGSSGTPWINFTEPNGTYTYLVGPVAHYSESPTSGSVNVIGAGVTVNVAFVPTNSTPPPPSYLVSLTETGLSRGTAWSADLAGSTSSSNTETINFTEPNGSYSLQILFVANYSSNYSSPVVVDGESIAVAVAFSSITYPVIVLESGLPTGAAWTVSAIGDTSHIATSGQSTGITITLRLAEGAYTLSAAGPAGYRVTLSPSGLTVSGTGLTSVTATFSGAAPSGVTSTSLPWFTTGVLVVTALVGLVGAGWGYRQVPGPSVEVGGAKLGGRTESGR